MSVAAALLKAALADVAGLTGVFDAVPVAAGAPYVTIGPDVASDWSHKTGRGRAHRVTINVWDDAPGTARARALLAAVEGRIAALTGTLGRWRVADVLFARAAVEVDPDGWTRATAEFRIRIEEI